ncbi:MAG: translation elongation factor Ts [Candidatus Saccharimonadia bacterium]
MASLEDIKKLRDMTGAGMMSAKRALEEADGNFELAIEILRKAGEATAAKKADRDASCGIVESYIHGGRIGVIVEVNCETDFVARTEEFKNFAHDIAMQVAAASPGYLNPSDVPEAVIKAEKEIFMADLSAQNKPADVLEKIIQGKIDKFYESACLTKQVYVKDPDQTIEQLTKTLIAKLGENIVIRRYNRLELGVYDN